jgi:hypothetical protein
MLCGPFLYIFRGTVYLFLAAGQQNQIGNINQMLDIVVLLDSHILLQLNTI